MSWEFKSGPILQIWHKSMAATKVRGCVTSLLTVVPLLAGSERNSNWGVRGLLRYDMAGSADIVLNFSSLRFKG